METFALQGSDSQAVAEFAEQGCYPMATFWVSGEDKEEAVEKEGERGNVIGTNTQNEGEGGGATEGESEVVKDNPMSGQAWEIDFGSDKTVKILKKIPKFLTRVRAQRRTPDTTECKVHPTSTPPARTGATKDATSSAKRKEGKSPPSASSRKSTTSLIGKSRTPATAQLTPTKSTSSTKALPHMKCATRPKTSTPLSSSSSSSSFSSIPRKQKDTNLIPPQSFSAPSRGAKGTPKTKKSSPSSSRLSLSSPKTLFLKRKTSDTSKTAKKIPLLSSTRRPLARDKLGESHASPVKKNQSVNVGERARGRGGKEGGRGRKGEVMEGEELQSSSSNEKQKTSDASKIAEKIPSLARRPLAQDKVEESRASPVRKSQSLSVGERGRGVWGPGKEVGRGKEGKVMEEEMFRSLSSSGEVGEAEGAGGGRREGAKGEVEEEGDGSEVLASEEESEERDKVSVDTPDYGTVWQAEWAHTKTPLQPPQTQPQELKTTISYGDKENSEDVGEEVEMKGGRGGGREEREEPTQLPVVTIPSLEKEAERDRSRAALYPNDMSTRKVFDLKRWYARGSVDH